MYYSNKGSVLIFILIVFSIVSTITMMCIGLNYSNSRTYVNSKGEEIYTCFDNSRFFAYDNNGKLIGILEQNPKKAFMGDDYAYHVVENGEIVNTSPANKFDLSVIRHGGTYKYTDGKNHHTLSDEQLANFADYYSSRQYLD